jgi:aerobic-type carbon monoxide dehydrogenase small subunit (CoxS/CutS family)
MAEVILGGTAGLKMTSGSGFLANTIALTVYCGGALLCAWLTLALMHTGAKIVSLNLGDRTAVKKILQNAFGKSLQPKSTTKADAIITRETSKP